MNNIFYKKAREIYYRLIPKWYPDIISYDEAFEGVAKIGEVSSYDVPIENQGIAFKKDAAHLDRDTYTTPEDFSAVIKGVHVSGRYEVVMPDGDKVLAESSNAAKNDYFPHAYRIRENIRTIRQPVTLLRSRFHNYYHLLIDVLPRLIAIRDLLPVIRQPVGLLVTGGINSIERAYLEMLNLESLPIIEMSDDTTYLCEEYVFTTLKTRPQSGYIPEPYLSMIREATVSRVPVLSEKRRNIFVSRQNADVRRVENFAEVQERLRQYGYEVVSFEDMSIDDQICTVNRARSLVGVHGAGLSNMIFGPEGLKVVEVSPAGFLAPHYYLLCKSLGYEYNFMYGSETSLRCDTFTVDICKLEEQLAWASGRTND